VSYTILKNRKGGNDMKKIQWLLLGYMVVLLLHMVQSPALAGTKVLSIRSFGAGSSYYFLYGGIVKIVNKYVPGVKLVLETTSGAVENARLTSQGKVSMAITNTHMLRSAYLGSEPFGEKERGGIRAMFGNLFVVHNWITLDPKIKILKDLKGKRIGFGKAGSAGATKVIPAYFKYAGLSLEDVKPFYIDYVEEVEALKDGHINAFWAATLSPEATILDLDTTHKVYWIDMDPVVREKMVKEYFGGGMFFHTKIDAGTYKGLTKDYPTVGGGLPLCVHKGVDDEIVYQIIKAIIEHVDELTAIHRAGKYFNGQYATFGIPKEVPFHPGAERYLKEKGLIK
jgi:TRAP transporter TAXI family solute receptor